MTTLQKVAVGLVVAPAIVGGYFFPGAVQNQIAGTSPAGSTFSSAKIAAINYTTSTSAASSTSLLNTDANDRYITDEFIACYGVKGQGITITAATTSVSSLGLQGNPNLVTNIFGTTTTSSTFFYVASSTESAPTYTGRLWAAGSYLTFVASSTNAGICTVGVHYLAS